MCRHTIADLAQVFSARPRTAPYERLPPADFARLRASLAHAGYVLRDDEVSNRKLKELRDMYEPYLHALAHYLYVELPPWILSKEITDNWKTSAWGRISGISVHRHAASDADDHF